MKGRKCIPLSLERNVQTEKLIMRQIMQLLQFHGWFVFRVPPSLYSHKGLCDLIAVRNGAVVFIEVKSPKGRQTEDQKVFERRIMEAGGAYILARSVEDVEELLTDRRRRARNSR